MRLAVGAGVGATVGATVVSTGTSVSGGTQTPQSTGHRSRTSVPSAGSSQTMASCGAHTPASSMQVSSVVVRGKLAVELAAGVVVAATSGGSVGAGAVLTTAHVPHITGQKFWTTSSSVHALVSQLEHSDWSAHPPAEGVDSAAGVVVTTTMAIGGSVGAGAVLHAPHITGQKVWTASSSAHALASQLEHSDWSAHPPAEGVDSAAGVVVTTTMAIGGSVGAGAVLHAPHITGQKVWTASSLAHALASQLEHSDWSAHSRPPPSVTVAAAMVVVGCCGGAVDGGLADGGSVRSGHVPHRTGQNASTSAQSLAVKLCAHTTASAHSPSPPVSGGSCAVVGVVGVTGRDDAATVVVVTGCGGVEGGSTAQVPHRTWV